VRYRLAQVAPEDSDPLEWWRANQERFPRLAALARRILCIPASSAPTEREFSHVNCIADKRRAQLSVDRSSQILFVKLNRPTYVSLLGARARRADEKK
jgi:hypothetical protein